jgi:hypothetical protein
MAAKPETSCSFACHSCRFHCIPLLGGTGRCPPTHFHTHYVIFDSPLRSAPQYPFERSVPFCLLCPVHHFRVLHVSSCPRSGFQIACGGSHSQCSPNRKPVYFGAPRRELSRCLESVCACMHTPICHFVLSRDPSHSFASELTQFGLLSPHA